MITIHVSGGCVVQVCTSRNDQVGHPVRVLDSDTEGIEDSILNVGTKKNPDDVYIYRGIHTLEKETRLISRKLNLYLKREWDLLKKKHLDTP